ncbi:MAG: ATP-binding protein [Nitrososphaeraceae archaeon]
MKIKPKLFVIILTLVLLSLLITSAFSINAFSQAMISEIKKRLEDNAVISMQQISFITSQKVSDAQMFSSLIGRLLESNQSAILDENALEQILGDVLAREANSTSPTFNSIAIYNKSGAKIAHKIIRANDNTDNLKFTLPNNSINEEFFETAIQGQSFHDNVPWHSSFLDESIIRVSAPISDRENSNDNVYSVLALTYPLNEILEHVTSINPDASSRSDRDDKVEKNIGIYLLSQNGTRIYYSNFFDTSREPNGTRNSYTPSIFKQIKDADNGIVSGIYPANIVDNPFGDERDAIFVATKGKIGNNNKNDNNTVASANNIANSDNKVEYDNMKENNWFLITSLGTESAFAEISNLRNIFILVTLVVLAGTAIAVFYISRIISKPIMKLKDAAISIEHGNLNIPFKPVSSKDEIGELAMNFEKMRYSIKKYTDALTGKEKELQQINDELIANDRAKEEFISMVSHELRTPLVPIKLYSEMLLRPGILGVLNKKQKKAVETINKNMLKQEQLVEDILDVFKLDMGTLHLAKQEIEIFNLVKDIVTDLKTFTIEKQIEITYEISTQSMKTIFCDSRRIEQVFVNLIKNSIDFVPDKTGKIKVKAQEVQDVPSYSTADIETKSTLDSGTVVFSVEDNGIGIPNQNANNLFKKFYQIDTSVTRKHGGTGLGLAICKGTVEAHDGRIWVDKNSTAGTALRFPLPRPH